MTTVHVLGYGRALCGSVHGGPAGWGAGHRWVSAFDPDSWRRDATCAECRRGAELLEAKAMSWDSGAVILPGPDRGGARGGVLVKRNPLTEQLARSMERGLPAEVLAKVRADSVTNEKLPGPDDGETE